MAKTEVSIAVNFATAEQRKRLVSLAAKGLRYQKDVVKTPAVSGKPAVTVPNPESEEDFVSRNLLGVLSNWAGAGAAMAAQIEAQNEIKAELESQLKSPVS